MVAPRQKGMRPARRVGGYGQPEPPYRPHAAAATMPTHERRFNTVAGLLAATPAHKALAAFAATL